MTGLTACHTRKERLIELITSCTLDNQSAMHKVLNHNAYHAFFYADQRYGISLSLTMVALDKKMAIYSDPIVAIPDFLIAKSNISNRHNISPVEVKSGKHHTFIR